MHYLESVLSLITSKSSKVHSKGSDIRFFNGILQQHSSAFFQSSWIREALSELDPSSEKITFIGNPHVPATTKGINRPHFRIRVPTALGEVEVRYRLYNRFSGSNTRKMDYPNDKEVLETFECEETVSFR